jgi:hypothetical protein
LPGEARERMQRTQVERYGNPVCSFDLRTGEIIKTYRALRHVEKDGFSPTAVRRVLQGKIPHCKYVGWRYA